MTKSVDTINKDQIESTDFFEAMPMTAGHFVFRDDSIDENFASEEDHQKLQDEIRTTAIITLVLVAVVAVALSVLLWGGLGALKGSLPHTTSPATNDFEASLRLRGIGGTQ